MNLKSLTGSVFALLLAGSLSGFEITESTRLFLPETPHESSILAAKEIAEYVKKSSGTELESPVMWKNAKQSGIVIGTLDTLKEMPDEIRKKLEISKKAEAFHILCRGNTLWIVGKSRVAELYGAYAFLDEKLGVRWFKTWTPEDSNEYVPKTGKIEFADFELFREPAFDRRSLSHSGATGKRPVHGQTLAVRQGFQIQAPWNFKVNFSEDFYKARVPDQCVVMGGHHTFVDAVPQNLFETHPEYFALRDGKRVKGHQFCLANPGVQELLRSHIEKTLQTYSPDKISILFGMIDVTTGWCECPECRALDETDKSDATNVSTRFHKVVTKIAAKLYEKYPSANLLSWAYHTYRSIPRNVVYDPKTTIYYCIHGRCYGHEFSDSGCARNLEQLKNIRDWMKISKKMDVYEYSNCTPLLYCPVEHRQAKDLRFYRELGISGWKEEMLFADAEFWPRPKEGVIDRRRDRTDSNWQWYCVTGKLLWNPDLNVDALLDDYESKYYGKAWSAMKKYHAFRRELWDNSSLCMGYPTRDQRRPQLLNVPGSREKLTAYLDEAAKLAEGDTVAERRVAQDREWLDLYWIKPNEEFNSRREKAYSAPTRIGKIKIDGDPSDPEWNRAFHSADFRFTFTDKGRALPPEYATTLSILSDDGNLYFRVLAKTPDPENLVTKCTEKDGNVFADDNVEFFIMPPSAAQEYFHVAVNAAGIVYDSKCPGNEKNVDLGVQAASKKTADGYVLEVKVPLDKIGLPERGELWRIHTARTCTGIKGHPFAGLVSLDAIEHHDTSGYRGIVIGSPRLYNGSFEETDKEGKAKYWEMNGASIIKVSDANAVKIGSYGNIYQLMYLNPGLAQSDAPRKIRVSLKASGGPGTLSIGFLRYTDTPNPKYVNGYARKIHPTENAGKFSLTEKTAVYSVSYTIRPGEWAGLLISYQGKESTVALVDDVSLALEKNK